MKGSVRIAIDIGGTFTDLQLVHEQTGQTWSHKTTTTPEDPSIGLVTGIKELLARVGAKEQQVVGLMHGTTIATNAILQRRFPRTALVTTAGFEDVLEIGRHVRRDVYSQVAEPRAVLIPRNLRFGLTERIDSRANIVRALTQQNINQVVQRLQQAQVEVVAISLLNSYTNSAHEEQLVEQIATQLPDLRVSPSYRVSPETREYERTSTTVLNALLMPIVGRYLEQLAHRLAQAGIDAPVYLVQSNGGVTTPEIATEQPVRLILSGPSGGARAVEVLSEQLAIADLIAIDMGGTSFDVAVIRHGKARLQTQGDIDSIPVRVPMLEIRTIGAGGGSLARVDDTGRLNVGPQSAGADPGPVAYGRGGTEPTVTDANIALGRIDPAYFLGGSLALDAAAAREALERCVAEPLRLDADQAAEGVITIAVSHMAAAIRLSLFEKGLDPADFALVSFGGAGGLHAALVAEELGASRIVFPADAGTQSAWGMLYADVVQDVSQSLLTAMNEPAIGPLTDTLNALTQRADTLMQRSGVEPARRTDRIMLDMRYPGQGWELSIASRYQEINQTMIDAAVSDFHQLHQEQFAHHDANVIPELVTMRIQAIGQMDSPSASSAPPPQREPDKPPRKVYLNGQWQQMRVIDRAGLGQHDLVSGPVIIEEPHSTIFLPEGWQASVHPRGALIASKQGAAQ